MQILEENYIKNILIILIINKTKTRYRLQKHHASEGAEREGWVLRKK